ncbi:DUF1571 domain-containing protein [Aporhodopirellula aestuarii]|uniref:DUF1571 domain-containing protein n=1 Tax=Aporhodopirellula aestuarii TaxID=2950107 RepID=A0ABT0U3G7_9BACT|nr:DUF1571 domain-containing protein [Aporhodopirellula aestuarii]MCM2371412.1 DUF1571 domain-containing protein [Aporhodopirellula aestuarii]
MISAKHPGESNVAVDGKIVSLVTDAAGGVDSSVHRYFECCGSIGFGSLRTAGRMLVMVSLLGVSSALAADDRNVEEPNSSDTTVSNITSSVNLKQELADEIASQEQDEDAAVEPVNTIGPGKQPPASLEPLIELARQVKEKFETEVDCYTCLLVKRETLDGKLEPTKYIRLKIRERRHNGQELLRPQCIYGRFLKPKEVAGREILYVENERDGDVLVRRGGTRLPNLTLEIDPEGRLAKQESNFSIVQTGIRPMVEQILDRMESQIDPTNVKIRYYADAKVDGRPCQHIEISQLERRPDSNYQIAKVYIDEELKLPVFFSSYAWPEEPDGKPILQEQYAITQINLNAELTDLDFDRTNPEYKFYNETE